MTIGLDIDDTMTNSHDLAVEYAKRYLNSEDEKLINELLYPHNIKGASLDFYVKYLPEMTENYVLKENVKEVIDRLRTKGHKLIVITARGYSGKKKVIGITKTYFKKYGLLFDEVIFMAKEKTGYCLRSKIDLMIDDSVSVLEKLKELNIKTLLFTSDNNKNINTNIDRVSNWLELEEYINNL